MSANTVTTVQNPQQNPVVMTPSADLNQVPVTTITPIPQAQVSPQVLAENPEQTAMRLIKNIFADPNQRFVNENPNFLQAINGAANLHALFSEQVLSTLRVANDQNKHDDRKSFVSSVLNNFVQFAKDVENSNYR